MTDARKAGVSLIVGCIGAVLTMAVHPAAGGHLTRQGYEQLALVSGFAHSVGIASVAILFIGACGLTVHLRGPDRAALAALVSFGVAAVAAVIAAAISGFIEPRIMLQMIRDDATLASQWRIVIDSIFQFNQAFAQIFTFATLIALVLWSAAALRSGRIARGIATYGCVAAPLLMSLVIVGHIRMDVHGMAMIVLAQSVWFVAVGVQLMRSGEA